MFIFYHQELLTIFKFKKNRLCKHFEFTVSFSNMNFLWALKSECTLNFERTPEFWAYPRILSVPLNFERTPEFWAYLWILNVPLNFERTPEFWAYPWILSVPWILNVPLNFECTPEFLVYYSWILSVPQEFSTYHSWIFSVPLIKINF